MADHPPQIGYIPAVNDPQTAPTFGFRRIAIVGAGAMGCSLAGMLGALVPTVLVVRRPERAAQIAAAGIRVTGAVNVHSRVQVCSDIAQIDTIPTIDLAFIATKTTDVAEVCRAMAPHRSRLPYLCAVQNGLVAGEQLIAQLALDRVVRMVVNYGAELVESPPAVWGHDPLQVHIGLHQPPHHVGGVGEGARATARELAQLASAAGLPTQATENIEGHAWRKGILSAATNPVAALLQAPIDHLVRSPAAALIQKLLIEGVAVAQASGVDLMGPFVEEATQHLARVGPQLPTMAHDLIVGRETELGQLNAYICALGRNVGIATPSHDAVCALVDTFDWRARGAPDLGLSLLLGR